jgi:hypothetical protein
MKVELPRGHNFTTARFQRVSRGVNYAYSGYKTPPAQVRPALGGFLVLCVTVALFVIAIKY